METQISASVVVAVITGLVEVFKSFVPDKRFWPLLAVVLGVLFGLTLGITDGNITEKVFLGLILGLSSSGLYDLAKNPVRALVAKIKKP